MAVLKTRPPRAKTSISPRKRSTYPPRKGRPNPRRRIAEGLALRAKIEAKCERDGGEGRASATSFTSTRGGSNSWREEINVGTITRERIYERLLRLGLSAPRRPSMNRFTSV